MTVCVTGRGGNVDAMPNLALVGARDRGHPASAAVQPPLFDPTAPTIFHQDWWLDAVTGGDYAQAVVNSGGSRIAAFPYVLQPVAFGHVVCGMPVLTHFLGPAIDDGRGAACNRILRRAEITRELLAQIPSTSGFWQVMHRGTSDTLVYQDLGFTTAVRFTFDVMPAEVATLWGNMRDKTRNVIRRAEEQFRVNEWRDAGAFAAHYVDNRQRAGSHSHYGTALIERVCQSAMSRGQGRIVAAEAADGTPMAAIFYVWDSQAAYYLMTTRRPDAHNGAVSLLLWDAMREVAARRLVFDFEGVVTSGSALFFTGFGGVVSPRYVVSRFSLGHRLAGRLSNPWRRRAGDGYV